MTLKAENHDPLSGQGRKPRRNPVTGRQLAVLTYLRRYIATYRCSPAIREVSSFFGLTSAQGGARHLQALLRKGMTVPLVGGNGRPRGYQLTVAGLAATEDQDLQPLPPPALRRSRGAACATP